MGHYKNMCRGGKKSTQSKSRDGKPAAKSTPKVAAISEETPAPPDSASLGQLSANWFLMSASSPQAKYHKFEFPSISQGHSLEPRRASTPGAKTGQSSTLSTISTKVPHMICDKSGSWHKQEVEPHARIEVELSVCLPPYQQLKLQQPLRVSPVRVVALADTGAQMCVTDLSTVERMGISRQMLPKPVLNVSVANNEDLKILGVAFKTITSPTGSSTSQMVYLADHVGEFYLSKAACRDLGIIDANFPAPHPPTSSLELGNQGGSTNSSGMLQLVANYANSNAFLPHVQHPGLNSSSSAPAQLVLGAQQHQGNINGQPRLSAPTQQQVPPPNVQQPAASSSQQSVHSEDLGKDEFQLPNLGAMNNDDGPPNSSVPLNNQGSSLQPRRASTPGTSVPTQVHKHDSLGRPRQHVDVY